MQPGCPDPLVLYHITTRDLVDDAQALGIYHCPSLMDEGFIHCCQFDQLAGVVERYYQDEPELCLLTIDRARLDVPVKMENTVGGSELFPHVYGPINMVAVERIGSYTSDSLLDFIATADLN